MRYSICSIKQSIILVFVFVFCYILFHPDRHAKSYPYIPNNQILSFILPNYPQSTESPKFNLETCNYDFINNPKELFRPESQFLEDYSYVKQGGEYSPIKCIPKYSTAVIVPYRNRPEQLNTFLKYMHSFLSKQQIHYRIFIADQNDTEPFNRASMLNYASLVAMNQNFSCLILHDIDLLPLNSANIYACTKSPRHMSCSIDRMRFNLPYRQIVGGVFAIQSSHFKMINGMSNLFIGWGGEDDDLYRRLVVRRLNLIRFSPWISRYTMLLHKLQEPSPERYKVLAESYKTQFTDGLNSLTRHYEVEVEPLYTHIIVN